MRDDLCEIVVVMDESGSMDALRTDAIGGFNSFLKEQQATPGDARLTLVKFNSEPKKVCDGIPIKATPLLDERSYTPAGNTALFDAIGDAIDSVGRRLSDTPEPDRPGKVMVAIITDGEENSSKRFTRDMIKEMIWRQQNNYNWQFIFLAANQDAALSGGRIGIKREHCVSYTPDSDGSRLVYSTMNTMTQKLRRFHPKIGTEPDIIDL